MKWCDPSAEPTNTMAGTSKYCCQTPPYRVVWSSCSLFFNQTVWPVKYCTSQTLWSFCWGIRSFVFCKKVRCSGELSLWCCWPVSHSNTLQSLVSFNWSYICLVLRAICMRTHREGLPAQVRCWPVWESRVSLHTFIRSYICWNPLSYPWETFFCHTG